MKKFLLVALLLIPVLGFSQIQWQDNGVPIIQAENINWNGASTTLTDGTVALAWLDSRDDSRQIYSQRIDEDGNKLWEEDGILVSNCQFRLSNPVIAPASDGGVFIGWYYSVSETEDFSLVVQKISSAGELCWTSTGITFPVENFRFELYLNSVDSGGVYISWEVNGQVKCKRLESDGSTATGWDPEGNVILSFTGYNAYNLGFITINDYLVCAGILGDYNINNAYMQKVSADGEVLWGILGTPVSLDGIYKRGLNVLNTPIGFSIGWKQLGAVAKIIIYSFFEDGTSAWLFPTEIVQTENYSSTLQLESDDSGFLYAGWYDDLLNENRIAKIDDSQNLLWGEQGIIAHSFNDYYTVHEFQMEIAVSGMINYIYLYDDYNADFYFNFNQFDSLGISTLTEPLQIAQIDNPIIAPSICRQNNSHNLLSWVEYKSGFDEIKYQIIDNSNLPILTVGGEVIFSGTSGQCLYLNTISMGDQIAMSWVNNKSGIISLQILNSNGITLVENGIPVAEPIFNYQQTHSLAYDEINENVIVAWQEEEDNFDEVFIQAVDISGNLLWGESGMQPTSSDWEQHNSQISTLEGVTYIGWTENNGDWFNPVIEIFANKIDASGNLLWGDSGVQVSNITGDDILTDIVGRCFIWRNEQWPSYTIYAKLLDENGNTATGWEEEGKIISDAEGTQSKSMVCEVPDGYLIVWLNNQNYVPTIYGQIVTENGNLLWDVNGKQLAEIEYYDNSKTKIYYDDGIYLIWDDFDNINYEFVVCMQKIDLNGNLLWPNNGIMIDAGENPDFIRIGEYTLVVYDYFDDYQLYNIAAKLINDAGEELWETVLCDEMHDQREPILSGIDGNNIVIGWKDNRAGIYDSYYGSTEYTSIYAQNVHFEPSYSPDDILNAITAKLHQNYPNPFNPSTTISFNLSNEQNEQIELVIYNLKGQKVKTFTVILSGVEGSGNNNYSVVWDGTDQTDKPVGTGIYFCKLKVDGKDKLIRKMMLIK
ncbi:MAG: T9SS type A sorting domain-containing protein [Candidatus Cloacimonadales bacterium]|nr:T9SS type A sorting domain-containing protein [Candidatus Cloacimonadales bacterium]